MEIESIHEETRGVEKVWWNGVRNIYKRQATKFCENSKRRAMNLLLRFIAADPKGIRELFTWSTVFIKQLINYSKGSLVILTMRPERCFFPMFILYLMGYSLLKHFSNRHRNVYYKVAMRISMDINYIMLNVQAEKKMIWTQYENSQWINLIRE